MASLLFGSSSAYMFAKHWCGPNTKHNALYLEPLLRVFQYLIVIFLFAIVLGFNDVNNLAEVDPMVVRQIQNSCLFVNITWIHISSVLLTVSTYLYAFNGCMSSLAIPRLIDYLIANLNLSHVRSVLRNTCYKHIASGWTSGPWPFLIHHRRSSSILDCRSSQ